MRIDLHCHLLWDIDDGAQSLEDTLALCETAAANNIRIIVATPHYMDYTSTADFLYARNRRIAQLNSLLRTRELPVHICGGAEVFLHDGIFEAGDLSPLTLNRSRYLLCEYSLQPHHPVRRGNDLDTFIADFPPEISAALVTYATQTAPQAVLQDADPNTIRHGAWDV